MENPQKTLSPQELARYSRQIILPGVGREGQERLKQASVLVIGMGGLGSPAGLYLSAAGVGHLGLVDFDRVEEHNLQRQIMHDSTKIDQPKVESAIERLEKLNPQVTLTRHTERLNTANARSILGAYDIVVDGTDNFPTRYLVNDTCVLLGKPLVYGSIFQFEGQASFFHAANGGPCYRCLFPELPEPGTVPNCEEAGVFGAICGVIGSIQAMEAIKFLTGAGDNLTGRLMAFDALTMQSRHLRVAKDPECPVCGQHPRITDLDEKNYQWACVAPEPNGKVEDEQVNETPEELTPVDVEKLLNQPDKAMLLDVREPMELEICQIPGNRHIRMSDVPQRTADLPRDKQIVVYCHHGARSMRVTRYLRSIGLNATNLKGGIDLWSRQIDPSIQRY